METDDSLREDFVRSLRKLPLQAIREIRIPQPTAYKVLRKRLQFKPYIPQLVQQLSDNMQRKVFCEVDETFGDYLVFSDEATFHLSGKLNKKDVRIEGTEQPHVTVQVICDLPKVNAFCAVSKTKVYGPFFSAEATVTSSTYPDMLEPCLWPISIHTASRLDHYRPRNTLEDIRTPKLRKVNKSWSASSQYGSWSLFVFKEAKYIYMKMDILRWSQPDILNIKAV
jgi:hypothetical protein